MGILKKKKKKSKVREKMTNNSTFPITVQAQSNLMDGTIKTIFPSVLLLSFFLLSFYIPNPDYKHLLVAAFSLETLHNETWAF